MAKHENSTKRKTVSYVSASGITGSIQVHHDHALIIKPGAGLRRFETGDIKRVEFEPAEGDEKNGWMKLVTDELHEPIKTVKKAMVDGNTIVFTAQSNDDFLKVQGALYDLLTRRPHR